MAFSPSFAHLTWPANASQSSSILWGASLVAAFLWLLITIQRTRNKVLFLKNGMHILRHKTETHTGKPFRMDTLLGETTVLPPSLIKGIRDNTDLSLRDFISIEFHSYLPGFETFGFVNHPSHVIQTVARKQLTQQLHAITEPFSAEAAFATDLIFKSPPEWQEIPIKSALLDLVARLSSRVFLGADVCRNEEWLRITRDFTTIAFASAAKLNLFPAFLRPLVNRLDPSCRQVHMLYSRASELLLPVFQRRRGLKEVAEVAGKQMPKFNDAIEWAEIESRGAPYDPTGFQLNLSFVAIHTTYDLLGRTLLLLAEHAENFAPLRQEMVDVLRVDGWTRTALNHMKLLDSAIKEAQRISPTDMITLRRVATEDVTLPDGTTIRKGGRAHVSCLHQLDPEVYPNPETFDIFRFKALRAQSGGESRAQLVTLTPDHLGFGYGVFACPGRFFACNEIKIALCHLLLKYDWQLKGGNSFELGVMGLSTFIDPSMKIRYRRRRAEIDVDNLGFGGDKATSTAETAS